MSDDIGAWYDRKRADAERLREELRQAREDFHDCPPHKSKQFSLLLKKCAKLHAELMAAEYVGD